MQTTPICSLRLVKETLDAMKRLAREKAAKANADVKWTDLCRQFIREGLEREQQTVASGPN